MTDTPRPPIPHDPAPAPDPLADYLEEVERDACFRVERTLKESPFETTQVVFFTGANGAELGPFVRKLIKRDAGLGGVYRELQNAHAKGLRPRYLPTVYNVHELGEELVVLMEHVPGDTLRQTVQQAHAKDRLELARHVVPALCSAAHELHTAFDQPIVHRDLTPSNVMCAQADPANLTVVDLGIAREHKPQAAADTAYFGTRPYAPPEQFGFGQTTPQTDIYALGMTLFFCLTGRDAAQADRKARFADPAVPRSLQGVVERATRLEPTERYASALDMKQAVEQAFLHLESPSAPLAPTIAKQPARIKPGSAAALVRRACAAVPHWVGRLWNTGVAALYALLLAACVAAIADPSPNNAHLPGWLLFYDYAVFLNLLFLSTAALLFDKRRIRRRFPNLPSPGARRTLAVYALFVVLNVALFYLANLIGNPLYA